MLSEIEIEKIAGKGQGVGTDPFGKVVFVPRALPGDLVRAEYPEFKKKYVDGELIEVLRPSSDRTPSPCEYFPACGGCDWLDWKYAKQLEAKAHILSHILGRAGLKPKVVETIEPAKKIEAYRTRVQLKIRGNQIGFYKRRTHELVQIDRCVVAHPAINEAIKNLKPRVNAGEIRQKFVEISVGDCGEAKENFYDRYPNGEFTQIHHEQNQVLVDYVLELISGTKSQNVLELYCGSGNFSFPVSDRVQHCYAVDSNPRAIERARNLASEHGVLNVKFACTPVNAALAYRLPENVRAHYDTLLLDPPRQGVGPFISNFVHPALQNIIYVSCAPDSFSQDAKTLVSMGFQLERVKPVDMFPHTRHFELIATFSRSVS